MYPVRSHKKGDAAFTWPSWRVPFTGETARLNVRHMLGENNLTEDILKLVNAHLARKGLLMKHGSIWGAMRKVPTIPGQVSITPFQYIFGRLLRSPQVVKVQGRRLPGEWDPQAQVGEAVMVHRLDSFDYLSRSEASSVDLFRDSLDAPAISDALIPNLWSAKGYQMEPDGFRLANEANGAKDFLAMQWTGGSGTTEASCHGGQGNRGDASGEILSGGFVAPAQGPTATGGQMQTALTRWQQGQGIYLPDGQACLQQELSDGIYPTLQSRSLALPETSVAKGAQIDVDGNGCLEQTQWLAANKQILAIDAYGDGQPGVGELLHLGSGAAVCSPSRVEASNDQQINASEPVRGALQLWMDINSFGNTSAEAKNLNQAGISAIDFGSNLAPVFRADASRNTLRLALRQGTKCCQRIQQGRMGAWRFWWFHRAAAGAASSSCHH